jgi:hypothetical protein
MYVILSCNPVKIKWPNQVEIEGLTHKSCVKNKRTVGLSNKGNISKELMYLKLKLFFATEKAFLFVNVGKQ